MRTHLRPQVAAPVAAALLLGACAEIPADVANVPQASGPDWAKIAANQERMQALCGGHPAVLRKTGGPVGNGERMSDYTCDFGGKRS